MVGWKRIVITVGEKIGKSHLTYARGACAELVAACTIRLADVYGLPVSTTHVLSSGVAGTMAANHFRASEIDLAKSPACVGSDSARLHVPRRGSVRLWTLYHLPRPRLALKR